MASKPDKDAVTGTETTGHEWDGIKELNTPLPKWWLYVFYATVVFSVIWWVLYPSWPWVTGYFHGILGYDQREALMHRISEAQEARAAYADRLREADLAAITDDPELSSVAFAGGQVAFNDNCAPCHGLGGAGQGHYPTLADDAWLWGGTLEAIHTTLLYGIRSDHPDTRFNVMPSYGVDGMLDRAQISDVAEYVLSLSDQSEDLEAAERGAQIFAEQCVVCHGEDGTGINDLGAPNLADAIWLYGGTKADIVGQVYDPQHGVMPAWTDRLGPETIKSLAVYVHSLGGGQ